MLKLFKKSIWIPYEDSTVYPTVAKAQQAIIKYCEDNGFLYEFTADDEVVISLLENEIYEINYLESDVRIPVGKIPNYLGEITVNVCGSNLLFFKNGEMFQTVEINN